MKKNQEKTREKPWKLGHHQVETLIPFSSSNSKRHHQFGGILNPLGKAGPGLGLSLLENPAGFLGILAQKFLQSFILDERDGLKTGTIGQFWFFSSS